MSTRNRREYLTSMVLDQAFLDRCQDNLENKLELVVNIESPIGTIHASDRNKYLGSTFYEALTQFPVVTRKLGEWLSGQIEFSTLTIALSNVDGRFNRISPAGADFTGWVNKFLEVLVGLRDVESTYTEIFTGRVTDVGGFQRDRAAITLIARDQFDSANSSFPNEVFTADNFPFIDDSLIGVAVPIIYGDYTVALRETKLEPTEPTSPVAAVPSIPAFAVNGSHPSVLDGSLELQLIISANDNEFFDTSEVFLKRGDSYFKFDAADVVHVTGNRVFTIKQENSGGVTLIGGEFYQYSQGDTFFVRVRGKDLGSYSDNIVWQARDILLTYGGIVSGDLDANWPTFRDKASPAQSAISTFKSRIWVQEPQQVMAFVASLLQQVRIEVFVSRQNKFKINSLHFEDFPPTPDFRVRNWDLADNTINPQLDDRNVWNRARASYNFDPGTGDNTRETPVFRNQASISQAGKEISKRVIFPNLYEEATVILQLQEMLKLASGYAEIVEMTLTPRFILKDLGEFVSLNIDIGSTVISEAPAMIREIGYDPNGLRQPVKVWSMQMINFPGYNPGHAGIVGGSTATITQET